MNKALDKRRYLPRIQTHSSAFEFDKAVLTCKRLISLDQKCYDHHYSWARIRSDQEEYRQAELKFREVSIRNPKDYQALNNLGICLARQDKYDQAIIEYKKGLEIITNLDLLHNIAITFTKKGDYEQAIEWYAKALELSPTDDSLHNCFGYLHLLQGKYEEAILKFNDAIQNSSRYCMSFFNKAIAYFCQDGLEEEAEEAFQNGLKTLSGGYQQKVQRLRSCTKNYTNELNRVVKELEGSSEMTVEKKSHLKRLKRSFEFILDSLKKECENFEKKL